jgi:2-polyprenyl-3-methyl-5-hydroxy-6-metoxy-1,4-benzoquinol methylase
VTDQHETVRAYDVDARAYAAAGPGVTDSVRRDIEQLAVRIGPGAQVLEIGSGGGRDAHLLESLGLRVRRTDITPGFVALLREQGVEADVLDPLVDDLGSPEGPYDAVWANASLLHVRRQNLSTVLARLAEVTRPGGVLRVSVKEGEGAGWSTHGSVRSPRHFTYWQAPALHAVVSASGWSEVVVRAGVPGSRGETWLEVSAVRDEVSP